MRNKKVKQMVMAALFMALILLLGLTPLGMIPAGALNLSILAVPVIVGAVLMGWRWGLVFGGCFAATSIINAFIKPSALVATLMSRSIAGMLVMSLLPRLLVPLVAIGVYQLLKQAKPVIRLTLCAIAGCLTNTVGYLGLMLLFYRITGLDSQAVLGVITGLGGVSGLAEATIAAIIVPPVLAALFKIDHRKD